MSEFRERLGDVEELIRDIDSIPDEAARGRVRDIVGLLLDLQGEGFRRLLAQLESQGESGRESIRKMAADDLLGGLLLVHGLHPVGPRERIREALERVRPLLGSHGGNVELVEWTDAGVLKLRLEGSCHGCPSSQETLRGTIEEALLTAVPEITSIVLDPALAEAARQP